MKNFVRIISLLIIPTLGLMFVSDMRVPSDSEVDSLNSRYMESIHRTENQIRQANKEHEELKKSIESFLRDEDSRLKLEIKNITDVLDADHGKAGANPTKEMTSLAEEIKEQVDQLDDIYEIEPSQRLQVWHSIVTKETVEEWESEVTLWVDEQIPPLEEKIESFKKIVKSENDRIAKEEAEAAAREAAARGSGRVPDASQADRLARLSQGISIYVPPIVIAYCPIGVACYYPGDNYIIITPAWLNRPDCKVRTAIAHESYHYYQWVNGMIDMEGGVIYNREELEAGANAYGSRYGC